MIGDDDDDNDDDDWIDSSSGHKNGNCSVSYFVQIKKYACFCTIIYANIVGMAY